MQILQKSWPLPACIEAINFGGLTYCIETEADYTAAELPAELRTFFATRQPSSDDPLLAQFETEKAAKEAAEFAAFKARSGAPTYKAASVHIAAEKLGVLTAIETAIDALISRAGDKSLYVWWEQIDTISRADAQWQQIEAEVEWGKDVTPEALFEMAAQV